MAQPKPIETPEPLHPDLMPTLRQLVRGLEVLFWALPFALLVCVQETMLSWWESWGIGPALAAMALLWYGTHSIGHFQKQERVWQGTVNFAQVLALLMVGLAPFLHWQQQITSDTMTWSQMSETAPASPTMPKASSSSPPSLAPLDSNTWTLSSSKGTSPSGLAPSSAPTTPTNLE